ncbi:MAG TPA: hypothetical protein VMZ26_08510 [Pyrinomonadaceae bacterium]|nr:hypothetical protein [Pyrinomonadaceae bacterium]
MRTKFGATQFDNTVERNSRAHSRDQLAVSWNPDGRVVAAWPTSRDGSGNWEVEVERFTSDFNLTQAINLRRGGQAGSLTISRDTYFLTPLPEFSERTRILALSGDRLALDDRSLLEWLITAEQQVVLGIDNHPLFETSLDDTACVIRRLPNGLVAMTEVPRAHVLAARERVRALLPDRSALQIDLTIETPVRTAARYFLTAVKEGELVQRAGKESEVTAFILIGRSGFRFGLWSPAAGLFSEHGFLAPKDIAQLGNQAAGRFAKPAAEDEVDGRLESYVREAFNQLSLQLSKEKLEQLQLSGYAQVVWASEPDLSTTIPPVAAEHAATTGIQVFHLEAPMDEAMAGGLLLGSFAFGDAAPVGAAILPQADLAEDLLVLADSEQDQRRLGEEVFAKQRRNRAIFTVLAPPVATAAVLLALLGGLIFTGIVTGIRDAQATARTQELKPALDRRNSYEANLKWYQEFIKQVSRLRRQQPVGIGMLYQLNSNYPYTVDPSFFISDMKLLPTGAVEMKGYARNKDAVASFLKSLEFAGGPESGSRLFGSLAYEVQESAPVVPVPAGGQAAAPVMAGSALQANQARPGIIVWSMKGNYIPMGEFQAAAPAKPGAAPTNAAAAPAPQPVAK